MSGIIRLFSFFLLFTEIKSYTIPEVYIIYSTGKGELRIKNVRRKFLGIINTFKIQTETTRGGIAVDYDRDQIFFADERNIYKIYLVDQFGDLKMSKRGDLFTNKEAEHFEVLVYSARRVIEGIYYDRNSTMLYAAADTDLIRLNTTSGKAIDSRYVGYNRYVRNPFIHDGVTYVYLHYGMQRYFGYSWGIYDNKNRNDRLYYKALVYGEGDRIPGFTIDTISGRLFLNMRSTIRVIDIRNTSMELRNPRIVLGDSEFTKGLESIAVYDKHVIWSSYKLNNLYIGLLKNNNFIPADRIEIFDHNVTSQHLCIFEVEGDGVGDVRPYRSEPVKTMKKKRKYVN